MASRKSTRLQKTPAPAAGAIPEKSRFKPVVVGFICGLIIFIVFVGGVMLTGGK